MYEFSKILTLQQLGHFLRFVFIYCTDIIMSTMVSRINSPAIVYSAVHSRADKKNTSKLRVIGLCEGDSLVTGEFPAQWASYTDNVSILWRYHLSNIVHHQRNILSQTGPV